MAPQDKRKIRGEMPSSLFQYEMLPTTWFYLSSLMILGVFFRFNRLLSVRNLDVLGLASMTPGLIYVAMGASFQGYLWLCVGGMLYFLRLAFDVFLKRRPLLESNLNYAGLAFSCVAASAFIIPNLFVNRGDACESPRAWRLEQILAAAEEMEGTYDVKNWPGYRPFLRAAKRVDNFFAPNQETWRAAVSEVRAKTKEKKVVDVFGLISIRLDDETAEKKHSTARAVQWAAGVSNGRAFDFEGNESVPLEQKDNRYSRENNFASPAALNGLSPAPTIPAAPIAPAYRDSDALPEKTNDVTAAPLTNFADSEDSEREIVSQSALQDAGYVKQTTSIAGEDFALILFVAVLQIALVITIILIGKVHFGSAQTGFACALLYLLLPYVNQFSARLDHIVPALAILLAVFFYRRPVWAGLAIGIAGSLVFYPFFLAPLWLGFYWKKGAVRFAFGLSSAALTLAVALLFLQNPSYGGYADALASMFGRHSLFLAQADGLWEYLPRFYRIPLIALFGVFCLGYALWVPRKNLATLISCTAALMLAVQFWMGRQGGLFMAWYLPLIVLTVFRPNLEDRIATTVVADL